MLFLAIFIKMSFIIRNMNNYDYNKAVFLMSNFKLLDNGFLTKEDKVQPPYFSVFYEFYDDISVLETRLKQPPNLVCC
jgi:hypothetical protein